MSANNQSMRYTNLLVASFVLLFAVPAFGCDGGPDHWGLSRPSVWVQDFTFYFPESVAIVHRDICRGDPATTGDLASLQYWWADLYCYSAVGCQAADWVASPEVQWWIPADRR